MKEELQIDVLAFMKQAARKCNVTETSFGRNLTLKGYKDAEKTAFEYSKDTNGIVYGYIVQLNEDEKKQLFNEAIHMNGNAVSQLNNIKEIDKDFYPLYWGKSNLVGGRLGAHLKGHKNNWNLHLCDYDFFQNKEIDYSVLMVSDNKKLEKYLNEEYPPILKTYKNN